jgi:hypothetical protein
MQPGEHTGFEYIKGQWPQKKTGSRYFLIDKICSIIFFPDLSLSIYYLSRHALLFFPCTIIRFAQLFFRISLVSPIQSPHFQTIYKHYWVWSTRGFSNPGSDDFPGVNRGEIVPRDISRICDFTRGIDKFV